MTEEQLKAQSEEIDGENRDILAELQSIPVKEKDRSLDQKTRLSQLVARYRKNLSRKKSLFIGASRGEAN